jgi:hypothetical protein
VCKNSYRNLETQQQCVQKFLLWFKSSTAQCEKILTEFESSTAMCTKILTVIQKLNSTVWKNSYRIQKLNGTVCKNSYCDSKAQQHSVQILTVIQKFNGTVCKVLPKLEILKEMCEKIHTETRNPNNIVWQIFYTWLNHNQKFRRHGHIIHLCLLQQLKHQFISSRYPCQLPRVSLCLHTRYVYQQIQEASGEIGTYIVGFKVPLGLKFMWPCIMINMYIKIN